MGANFLATVQLDQQVGAFAANLTHADGGKQLDVEAPGLLLEAVSEVATSDAIGKAGIVLDAVGDAGLAAEAAFLDDDCIEAFSAGVDAGGEPGGAPADDGYVVERQRSLQVESEFLGELFIRWFDEHGAVSEFTIGMERPPFWTVSTWRRPDSSVSTSTHLYSTRWAARNFFERLQSGHQGAP